MNKTRKITMCGLMTALAMIFSYIEALMPIPVPVPGVKLGIANMAIIVVLYTIGISEAVIVDILRVTLTAMLFGNFNSFLFSISGAVLSIAVMVLLKKINRFSEVGVSVAGGVAHNVGQIIAAVFIMQTSAIAYYLPVLMVSGIVTGVVIGIVAALIVRRVEKLTRK
jgi:heptaprenyl diphosphate synthase